MTLTCGLIANLYGPVERCHYDAYMWINCQPVRTSGTVSLWRLHVDWLPTCTDQWKGVVITLTCGLIANLYGPVERCRYDAYMWIDCQHVRTSGTVSLWRLHVDWLPTCTDQWNGVVMTLTCGLIANLYGPVEGRRYDAYMLQDSKIIPQLTNKVDLNGEPYYLFGDPAYSLLPVLLTPYTTLYSSQTWTNPWHHCVSVSHVDLETLNVISLLLISNKSAAMPVPCC